MKQLEPKTLLESPKHNFDIEINNYKSELQKINGNKYIFKEIESTSRQFTTVIYTGFVDYKKEEICDESNFIVGYLLDITMSKDKKYYSIYSIPK